VSQSHTVLLKFSKFTLLKNDQRFTLRLAAFNAI